MKTNHRRLAVLLKWFPTAFYCITMSESNINLQGAFHSKTVTTAKVHGFKDNGLSANGYVTLTRGNIEITLTEMP